MTFLRRFRDPPAPRASQVGEESESIAYNLTHVLRSENGYSSFRRDFGLVDPFQHPATPRSMELLRAQIQEQIERHEPRLQHIDLAVLPRDSEGSYRFVLTGRMSSGTPLRLIVALSRARHKSAQLEVRMSG